MKKSVYFFLLLLLLIVPNFVGPYFTYLINMMIIYAISSIGLNLLYGFAGQISLGHGAFVGIGAYSCAILTLHYPWMPYLIVLLISGVISLSIGILLAVPSFRLSGYYLALATLAFSLFTEEVLMHWNSLTKGPAGISIPSLSILGMKFDSDLRLFYLMIVIAIPLVLLSRNILITKTGRAFLAIRENESATQMLGISVAKYKTIAFSLSAMYAGIAGGLYAPLVKFVYPTTFGLNMSILFLIIVILGGPGSIVGSIFGAILLTILPEILSETKHLLIIIEGAILALVVIFMPNGIVGFLESLYSRFRSMKFQKSRNGRFTLN
jgi:branched-chain amino acid transport system permease protein